MTDRDQDPAGGQAADGSGPRGSDPSSDDLALDARARTLMLRLVEQDDGAALSELIDLLEPRLLQSQDQVLDELGAGVPLPLADEWFAAHLVASLEACDVPLHPLAAACEWMSARGRALVNALSAQPLPWEPGHDGRVLDQWFARLGLASAPSPELRLMLVVHHRLPEATRQVLRDLQIRGLTLERCAEARGLSPERVRALYAEGRLASVRALERLHGGASDAD